MNNANNQRKVWRNRKQFVSLRQIRIIMEIGTLDTIVLCCKIIIYDNIKVEWNHFASLFKCLVIIDLTYAPGL